MSFIAFLCLIVPARNLCTVVNSNDKCEHLCSIVLDLKGKVFPIDYDVSCQLFIYDFYYVEVVFSLRSLWGIFVIKVYWIFSNTLSVSVEMLIWVLSFVLLIGIVHWVISHILYHPYIQDKSHLVMEYGLFNVLLNSVC